MLALRFDSFPTSLINAVISFELCMQSVASRREPIKDHSWLKNASCLQ